MRAGLRKNSRPHQILKTVLLGGGVLLISMVSPMGGALIVRKLLRQYFREKRWRRERFLQDLKRLQHRELIDWREFPDGKVTITLTKLGKQKVLMYNLDRMKLQRHAWDGKWRLVTFDIPKRQKQAREALRKKMRDLGFYPLQKSVFLTPYPCENEIDFICSVFEVNRSHVLLLNVSDFEGSEKLQHHFSL